MLYDAAVCICFIDLQYGIWGDLNGHDLDYTRRLSQTAIIPEFNNTETTSAS